MYIENTKLSIHYDDSTLMYFACFSQFVKLETL